MDEQELFEGEFTSTLVRGFGSDYNWEIMETDSTEENISGQQKLKFDPWQAVTASGSNTPPCPSRKLARFGL